jgi:meso-butanediol dehydrogenase/(S,S)-butanediol dehydrogenase/diacetyl reductase
MSLTDKKVVITGGARGIGAAIAEALAKAGADVVIADIDGSAARATAETLNASPYCTGKIYAQTVDVTDKASVTAMFAAAIDSLGDVDVLFRNAGIIKVHPFIALEEDDWDAIMAVNVKGVFLCGQAAARHILARGNGKIINTASVAGRRGVPGSAAYGASKAAVISLTQSMAAALTSVGWGAVS